MSDITFKFWPGSLELENKPAHLRIAEKLEQIFSSRHGYLAYKLTNLGRSDAEQIPSFLIITQEHGIIVLDVIEEKLIEIKEKDGNDFWLLNDQFVLSRSLEVQIYEEEIRSRLRNDTKLYNRFTRKVTVPITSYILFCKNDDAELDSFGEAIDGYGATKLTLSSYEAIIKSSSPSHNGLSSDLDKVISLLEGTFIYQAKTEYKEDKDPVTINDFIQLSLKSTFKQDDSQRSISMQLPDGPQRIRGLAGTGKTIVLSLKAAITHKRLKDYKILYLFNTQSLYGTVSSLITQYYSSEAKKSPDFENNLHILHAWGGWSKPGLYSELCKRYGLIPLKFDQVRGANDSLKYIYKDLLSKVGDKLEPIYDLVLIDEAQDFPEEVFEVIFKITKNTNNKKRIVWAYDEFQSLKEASIKEPVELFGKDEFGKPNMPNEVLQGEYAGGIEKDFILPNCYRTPRPILMIAHGIAMGIHSKPIHMLYGQRDWKAIGYTLKKPSGLFISAGDLVEVEREDASSKNTLEQLLKQFDKNPLDLIQFVSHQDENSEFLAVTAEISRLIKSEDVKPEEIIIVNLKKAQNKESMLRMQKFLDNENIKSVLPGYVESADVFRPKGFVTISTPYRAKGNEANIVFVINAQTAANDFTLRARNSFFVAVTRSRGWCYISGNGNGMDELVVEMQKIKDDFPSFIFECPSEDAVQSSRSLISKSDKELDEIQRAMNTLMQNEDLKAYFLEALQKEKKQ